MTKIRSFSGAHTFDLQCFVAAIGVVKKRDGQEDRDWPLAKATTLAELIRDGTCPRCTGPLDLEFCAGSRTTTCRCVPICPRCGSDEAFQGGLSAGLAPVWLWPLRGSSITRRANLVAAKAGPPVAASIETTSMKILTDTGVSDFAFRPHPGGWAEYGYRDDTDKE